MKLFGRDLETETALIAEIGVNHEGDLAAALDLVRAAADAGADAVKFQSYTPERFIASTDAARLERVTRFGLDRAAHDRLAEEATARGVSFFSSAISEDWVPVIAELSSAIKIASGDLTFEPVIRAAAATGKQVVLSTGCGNDAEVDEAVGWVRDEVGASSLPDRLVLLHCVSEYPSLPAQTNLLSIPYLAGRHGVPVGWSNHVVGPEVCIAAVALGAQVVEVHVTDRKGGREFRDHALSFEPADLAALAKVLPEIRASRGVPGKRPTPAEEDMKGAIRKGIVAARDLDAGAELRPDDLMYARPATGFPSSAFESLLGRRLTQSIGRGVPLQPEHLEDVVR